MFFVKKDYLRKFYFALTFSGLLIFLAISGSSLFQDEVNLPRNEVLAGDGCITFGDYKNRVFGGCKPKTDWVCLMCPPIN